LVLVVVLVVLVVVVVVGGGGFINRVWNLRFVEVHTVVFWMTLSSTYLKLHIILAQCFSQIHLIVLTLTNIGPDPHLFCCNFQCWRFLWPGATWSSIFPRKLLVLNHKHVNYKTKLIYKKTNTVNIKVRRLCVFH
jgi:hypothetical protein